MPPKSLAPTASYGSFDSIKVRATNSLSSLEQSWNYNRDFPNIPPAPYEKSGDKLSTLPANRFAIEVCDKADCITPSNYQTIFDTIKNDFDSVSIDRHVAATLWAAKLFTVDLSSLGGGTFFMGVENNTDLNQPNIVFSVICDIARDTAKKDGHADLAHSLKELRTKIGSSLLNLQADKRSTIVTELNNHMISVENAAKQIAVTASKESNATSSPSAHFQAKLENSRNLDQCGIKR